MAPKKTVKREAVKPARNFSPSSSDSISSPERDETFLRRTLELARQNIGLTSPNPCVGAVILDREGHLAGEGSHAFAGVKHAEVIALEQAGEQARGGVLYVILNRALTRAGPALVPMP